MPPVPLALTLEAVLPRLSPRGRAVINLLVITRGVFGGAEEMATRIGVTSRFRLGRLLRREGLPPFGELADWTCVLQLLSEAELQRAPLLRLARLTGLEPATCYRRCKRLLGVPWRVARARGFAWALVRFLRRCRRPPHAAVEPRPPVPPPPVPSYRPGVPAVIGLGRRGPALPSLGPAPPGSGHPQGSLAATLRLRDAPTDIAVSAGGAVLATRAYAASVERLDLPSLKSVASVPVGCNPVRLVFDRSGRRAYVSNQMSDSISVIDVATNRRVDDIAVRGWPAPVVISPDERTLFVTTNADRLYAIQLATKRVVAAIPLPATSHHLTMHPSGKLLYVATRAAGTVMEIDATTFQILRTFPVGGQTQALAVSADGTELYVADEAGGLDVLDLRRGTQAAAVRLDGRAYGLALSRDNRQLYVGLVTSERVQVVDRESLRVVRTIPTGGVPREITFSPSGKTALIANEAGWIDVVT